MLFLIEMLIILRNFKLSIIFVSVIMQDHNYYNVDDNVDELDDELIPPERRIQRFRPVWRDNPDYQRWLRPV